MLIVLLSLLLSATCPLEAPFPHEYRFGQYDLKKHGRNLM